MKYKDLTIHEKINYKDYYSEYIFSNNLELIKDVKQHSIKHFKSCNAVKIRRCLNYVNKYGVWRLV